MRRALIALVLVAACGATDDGPRIDAASPPFAPLSGGTVVRLTGAGMPADARVVIGGREAAVVIPIDDATLDVLVPPGERPGDTDVIVLGGTGNTVATDVFRYSAPPVIADISPRQVVSAPEGGTIVVTGSGFLDDDAGDTTVLLDGLPVGFVRVVSDTQLEVGVPNLRPLLEPTLTLVNKRGTVAIERAYRYRPSVHGGLLLFARGSIFAFFVDPVRGEVVAIPRAQPIDTLPLTAVTVDDRGDYWGIDRNGTRFGRIDMRTHTMDQPLLVGERIPALARIGVEHYGIARDLLAIGRLDITNGNFAAEFSVPCCGGYGLSYDQGKLWFTSFEDFSTPTLSSWNPTTGDISTPIPLVNLPGSARIEDLRHFQGVLYAICRDGTLRSIDPSTGDTAVVANSLFQIHAMEAIE